MANPEWRWPYPFQTHDWIWYRPEQYDWADVDETKSNYVTTCNSCKVQWMTAVEAGKREVSNCWFCGEERDRWS